MKPGRVLFALAAFALMASCRDDDAGPVPGPIAEAKAEAAADSLTGAIAGAWRTEAEKARDPWRHPAETLAFFGVKPSDTVVEIAPGGGWYTAILGPWLKAGGGKLYAAHVDPASSANAQANVDAYKAAFVDHPETYGDITLTVGSRTSSGLAPDGSADAVLTFRNVHNWMAGGYADKIFEDAFRALKPGGVLGVEEHRLPSARDQDLTASTGYVLESYVVQLAQNAGFVLEESSEINANPKDNADHPLGVWMLPPNLREPQPGSPEATGYDKAKYQAIGESDRMTLRFRKPAPAPAPEAATAPAAPAAPPAQ
ncbi:MAG TPA: methyltransferase domain-containing protein [Hyphomonadaceae bacterium]|nr:methyltransferase domain-containing protein [Hyphomonadaceae bacterium]HPI48088.1 methyltransferase domain-containing protein [Hyphomonadaceae bacterium]